MRFLHVQKENDHVFQLKFSNTSVVVKKNCIYGSSPNLKSGNFEMLTSLRLSLGLSKDHFSEISCHNDIGFLCCNSGDAQVQKISIFPFHEIENLLIKPEHIVAFSSDLRLKVESFHIQFIKKGNIGTFLSTKKMFDGGY